MADKKTRARTLQERFGFQDDELKTPKHDEIMLWLDANAERFIRERAYPKEWDPAYVADLRARVEEATASDRHHRIPETWRLGDPPPVPPLTIEEKVWEYPITTGKDDNPYVVGFVDMRIVYSYPELHILGIREDYNLSNKKHGWQIMVPGHRGGKCT